MPARNFDDFHTLAAIDWKMLEAKESYDYQ